MEPQVRSLDISVFVPQGLAALIYEIVHDILLLPFMIDSLRVGFSISLQGENTVTISHGSTALAEIQSGALGELTAHM